MKTSGIYIHIPFCVAKCIYCDFYSVAGQDDRIDDFIESLITEIKTCQVDTTAWIFDTIFIGGGTPSLLSAKHLDKITNVLRKKYDLSNIIEFTLEANPGEAPREKLKSFHNLGVNRLSIGVQSFKPNLLQFLSRIHSVEDIFKTFQSARDVGFENINCDLIYNIPNQTLDDWKFDLEALVELDPEHISAYSLTVENNTPLYTLVKNNSIVIPEDDLHQKFNKVTNSNLKDKYTQYEISNYSKQKRECFHNLHYWENDNYLGFGPSAHSFDGTTRWNNFSSVEEYNSLIKTNESPIVKFDELTEIDKINEIIGFGLRMSKGFKISKIPNTYKRKFQNQLDLTQLKFPKMIIEDGNQIKLTQKGLNFADAIAVELMIEK